MGCKNSKATGTKVTAADAAKTKVTAADAAKTKVADPATTAVNNASKTAKDSIDAATKDAKAALPKPDLSLPGKLPASLKLPAGCETAKLKGLTATNGLELADGRVVSLLGVDTPDLSKNEPSAKEASDLLKKLCPDGSTVNLLSDGPDADKKAISRYVYVKDPKSSDPSDVTCLNTELLKSGLGQFSNPTSAKLSKADELLKAANASRETGTGLWKTFDDKKMVYTVKNGDIYHYEACAKLTECIHLIEMTAGDAVEEGMTRCRVCAP